VIFYFRKRTLVVSLPRSRNRSMSETPSAVRFSQTEMWKTVLAQLVCARVVNAKHMNGSLTPVMFTSSAVNSVGGQLYALLFESLPANTATITCDAEVSFFCLFALKRKRVVCGCFPELRILLFVLAIFFLLFF
jgi:hypothetical protein